ncbi:MAG: hypothetical protein L6Q54_10910 [Leptospiraceae bacterium]|nr:hypothetical protein [Leptospiraceae bacterium]MCK6381738.1 hypothetical protein [Leptospiraceae bacterium]NUM42327.1 hypothetical protein [Leptospiraceae bacterium]
MNHILIPIGFAAISIFLINCTTIEFIPDSDYDTIYEGYAKQSYRETEIHTSKPKKPFRILGSIVIRNFEGNLNLENDRNRLQKEMFNLKVDGVWLTSGKIQEVDPMIIRTQNREGLPVAYYESNKEMAKITGLVFRYKNGNRKN